MLLDNGAENIELAPGSFHAGSENMENSECCQLGNAVGWRSGRAVGGRLDRLRGGLP